MKFAAKKILEINLKKNKIILDKFSCRVYK